MVFSQCFWFEEFVFTNPWWRKWYWMFYIIIFVFKCYVYINLVTKISLCVMCFSASLHIHLQLKFSCTYYVVIKLLFWCSNSITFDRVAWMGSIFLAPLYSFQPHKTLIFMKFFNPLSTPTPHIILYSRVSHQSYSTQYCDVMCVISNVFWTNYDICDNFWFDIHYWKFSEKTLIFWVNLTGTTLRKRIYNYSLMQKPSPNHYKNFD